MPAAFLPSSFIKFLGIIAIAASTVGMLGLLDRLQHSLVVFRSLEHFTVVAVVAQIVGTSLQGYAHPLLFGGLVPIGS